MYDVIQAFFGLGIVGVVLVLDGYLVNDRRILKDTHGAVYRIYNEECCSAKCQEYREDTPRKAVRGIAAFVTVKKDGHPCSCQHDCYGAKATEKMFQKEVARTILNEELIRKNIAFRRCAQQEPEQDNQRNKKYYRCHNDMCDD